MFQDASLASWNTELVSKMAMKLETTQMELEGAVNQREAAKEALAKEAARFQVQHEEALSRRDI